MEYKMKDNSKLLKVLETKGTKSVVSELTFISGTDWRAENKQPHIDIKLYSPLCPELRYNCEMDIESFRCLAAQVSFMEMILDIQDNKENT